MEAPLAKTSLGSVDSQSNLASIGDQDGRQRRQRVLRRIEGTTAPDEEVSQRPTA